jgi:hypothetical protein
LPYIFWKQEVDPMLALELNDALKGIGTLCLLLGKSLIEFGEVDLASGVPSQSLAFRNDAEDLVVALTSQY